LQLQAGITSYVDKKNTHKYRQFRLFINVVRISLLEEGRKFHFTGTTDQLVQIHALVKLICSFKKMRVCYLLYSFVPNM